MKSADITGGVTASLYIARFVLETTEQIHSGGIRDDLLAVSLVWSSCVLDITADVYADSGSFTANSLQGAWNEVPQHDNRGSLTTSSRSGSGDEQLCYFLTSNISLRPILLYSPG